MASFFLDIAVFALLLMSALGIVGALWTRRLRPWHPGVFVVLVLLSLQTWIIVEHMGKPKVWIFRQALPLGASEIREVYRTDSLLPDYNYCLKARIDSRETFERYVKRLGLRSSEHEAPQALKRHGLVPSLGPYSCSQHRVDWWDAPSDKGVLWWRVDGDSWIAARYIQGHAYLKSINM